MRTNNNTPLQQSQIVHFALRLIAERGTIADVVVRRVEARLSTAKVSAMFARTLVTSASKAIELSDPEILVAWCRMARDGRSPEIVSTMLDVCFDYLIELAPASHLDVSALIVFLEIIRSRTATPASEVLQSDSARSTTAIATVLSLLKARDEGTCNHSHATGMWAQRLCVTLGVDAKLMERIVRSAVLHDIGKIATPDAVLFKPGPLDGDEWSIMQQHAAYGADILSEIPSLAVYAPIVRSHHERYDGLGYPDRYIGEEIPFEARVVSVADAFHAMIIDRPYRRALSIGRATAILAAGRDEQWQGDIVEAMIATAIAARNESTDAQLAIVDAIQVVANDVADVSNG